VCFHVPISIMKHTMLVSSMGGEMIEDKHICPAISITIKGGIDFLANLIILDSKGIHIIVDIDWLR
jgi:hypothetical protein